MSTPITPPGASVDVPALLAELASLRDDLRAVQREQQDELERYRLEVAEEREERARRARAGDLGREWQTLQRRIDLGETTLDAVVRGGDDSAQAEVVRGFARENAETLAGELDDEVTQAERGGDVSPAARAALESRALAAEIRGQLDRLRQLPLPTL